jgi:hypothetical protein
MYIRLCLMAGHRNRHLGCTANELGAVKFFLDHDLPPGVGRVLRQEGHDFSSGIFRAWVWDGSFQRLLLRSLR